MASSATSALHEFEGIEADDALHDFGGPHGSKGHDFAAFWVILRLTELEGQSQQDYVFVCEYMQDVAEFDSSTHPTSIQLFQLKKKEDGYWEVPGLTGQSGKSKVPKVDKPLWKLLKHVRAVKLSKASGAFISNAKFKVPLASGQASVNDTRIGLQLLDDAHTDALRNAVAKAEGLKAEDVDLSVIELRSEAIAINDLQRHANGVMLEFLSGISPQHAGQAASLVETLYVRIKAKARRTEKCSSWQELMERRGFSRASFQKAIQGLELLPDKSSARQSLFEHISSGWRNAERLRVQAALTKCAMEKVLTGETSRWRANQELESLFQIAENEQWDDNRRFESACTQLVEVRAELSIYEIKALALYEMTEWDLNQILA